ncbi:MAG: sigma-70 family RNA polymerase sigma factor [Planctomycetia bacterium]|nr:sigma-70 family RNA polymerase sigma factor [Planctomycetia bacterium]
MDSEYVNSRLSGIQTMWTLVRKAHQGQPEVVKPAQEQLLARYGGAVKRYLRGLVRDADTADDLFQEFAVRLIKGDLHNADPQRGKFRNYVKGVLFHLVADFHQRKKRQPVGMGDNTPEPAISEPSHAELDAEFLHNWRDDLLARSWLKLEGAERQSGKPFYTVLRFRSQNPELTSDQLAAQLSVKLGKPLTAAGVRQTLHRARERFSEIVLDEVVHSLDNPTPRQLEEELIDLGLMKYCKPALERRHPGEIEADE